MAGRGGTAAMEVASWLVASCLEVPASWVAAQVVCAAVFFGSWSGKGRFSRRPFLHAVAVAPPRDCRFRI